MKLKILVEDLKDITTEDTLYHYTDFFSLIDILKSGYLKPSLYASSLTGKPEICTGRKALKTEFCNINTKVSKEQIIFHLYSNRIIGSKEHRNIRKTPFAEFKYRSSLYINRFIKKYNKEAFNIIFDAYAKASKNFSKHLNSYELYDVEKKSIKKLEENKLAVNDGDLEDLLFKLKNYNINEFEERFYFNNKKFDDNDKEKINYGIKVDPRFMKIEIAYYPNENFKVGNLIIHVNKLYGRKDKEAQKEAKEQALELFKKYDDVFIKNKNYKNFIDDLENAE